MIMLDFVYLHTCPIDDYDCPYNENGYCTLDDPYEECDDFAYYEEDKE